MEDLGCRVKSGAYMAKVVGFRCREEDLECSVWLLRVYDVR